MPRRLCVILVLSLWFAAPGRTESGVASSSPYGITAVEGAPSPDLALLCKDLQVGKFVCEIKVYQLTQNGQPVSAVEAPLGLADAYALSGYLPVLDYLLKVHGVALYEDPAYGLYKRLHYMVREHSPDEASKLRNIRTLQQIFECDLDASMQHLQRFCTTEGFVYHSLLVSHATGRVVYVQHGTRHRVLPLVTPQGD